MSLDAIMALEAVGEVKYADKGNPTQDELSKTIAKLIELKKAKVNFYKTPDAILKAQLDAWDKVTAKKAGENALFKKVMDSQRAFAERAVAWAVAAIPVGCALMAFHFAVAWVHPLDAHVTVGGGGE